MTYAQAAVKAIRLSIKRGCQVFVLNDGGNYVVECEGDDDGWYEGASLVETWIDGERMM